MKVLFLGDVVGRPGRNCLRTELGSLVEKYKIDFTVVNGENAAGGIGITPEICSDLLNAGVDIITTGNHIFKKKEIYEFLNMEPRLLKPVNYPPGTPGHGYHIADVRNRDGLRVAVINLCGRVFIENLDCPFRAVAKALDYIREETPLIIVDMHAEVTSEKVAMGWYLDGKVSAVIGTHTHIQTADERILPGGTAYITDAGMVGPRDSVIGVRKENIIQRFITLMPQKFSVASDDVWINGVVIEIDEENGKSSGIERINRPVRGSMADRR